MCRGVRGSKACGDLANAERDAGRLVLTLERLAVVGALPAGVVELSQELADVMAGAFIHAGA